MRKGGEKVEKREEKRWRQTKRERR